VSEKRIIFFGTPDFAATSLQALLDRKFNVVAVVTAPDKPAGRGHHLQASAVKMLAESAGIPVLQPTNLKSSEFVDDLAAYRADLQIVVAFRMLPECVWNMPPLGTYNVHASLLPKYRGAAPINWAIAQGETKTGVTTFKLKHEIDTGSILVQKETAIGPDETAGELYVRLMHLGAEALVASVELIENGNVQLVPQSTVETKHAPKLSKEDAHIDWHKAAEHVHNQIRGMNPFPGSFVIVTTATGDEMWKLHRSKVTNGTFGTPGSVKIEGNRLLVSTTKGAIEVLELQLPGKKRVSADEFIRGYRSTGPALQFT
jgi:methionyl-tRNA formyltransferase